MVDRSGLWFELEARRQMGATQHRASLLRHARETGQPPAAVDLLLSELDAAEAQAETTKALLTSLGLQERLADVWVNALLGERIPPPNEIEQAMIEVLAVRERAAAGWVETCLERMEASGMTPAQAGMELSALEGVWPTYLHLLRFLEKGGLDKEQARLLLVRSMGRSGKG